MTLEEMLASIPEGRRKVIEKRYNELLKDVECYRRVWELHKAGWSHVAIGKEVGLTGPRVGQIIRY